MKKLLLSIIILFVFSSFGCSIHEDDVSDDGFQGFSKDEMPTVSRNEQLITFEKQLKDFKKFNSDFFKLWEAHLKDTEAYILEFNSSFTDYDKKKELAIVLLGKYEIFRKKVELLNPPDLASKAHELSLQTIEKRILYFKAFSEGVQTSELNEIGREAYKLEDKFWDEIELGYDYLIYEANRLGLSTDEDFTLTGR